MCRSIVSISTIGIIILITFLTVSGLSPVLSDCSAEAENSTWAASLQEYPKLEPFLRENTEWQNANESRELYFLNWQDDKHVFTCPLPDVVEWTYTNRAGDPDPDIAKALKGDKSDHLHVVLSNRFEYLRTYSCRNSSGCVHHFVCITKPFPMTEAPVQVIEGSDVGFKCDVFLPLDKNLKPDPTVKVLNAPFKITWTFPTLEQPDNVEIVLGNVLGNDSGYGDVQSALQISNSSRETNAGIHECVVTDKYGVTSVPFHTITSTLHSRFKGRVYVHVRPITYLWLPVVVMAGMALLLPLMIRFCPTNEKEADLEEEDSEGSPNGDSPENGTKTMGPGKGDGDLLLREKEE